MAPAVVDSPRSEGRSPLTSGLARALVAIGASATVLLTAWYCLGGWDRFSTYESMQGVGRGEREAKITWRKNKWGAHRNEPHGPFVEWWWLGGPKSVEGRFHHGTEDGVWTYWDDMGDVVRQEKWRRGEALEERTSPPWLGGAEKQ